jgi:hypothetical protein
MCSVGPTVAALRSTGRAPAGAILIIRHGALGPDATPMLAALARVGRSVLWWAYLGAYRRAGKLDRAAVERWLPVMAAARLAEDIPGERAQLQRMALA